ncbi:hypothetical protein [Nonomuraea wenchangensis]|uniref:Uncharacterized protein n=1 Tax=Nonomuraea wenchangensis TaxID=568860 RepID=A0A1I0EVG1_9ACTN|nr:hypothetical protein [Nonomuraea wenchangensis]SET49446.1 hypothetical protein SAMN05421811_103219 [Nonomuraea wenchangensis]
MNERSAEELDRLMKFDDLVCRVYADDRMPPGTREVALAMAWALERGPVAHPEVKFWTLVRRSLGGDRMGRPRLSELIAADAPRYENRSDWSLGNGSCEGPRVRPYKPRERPPSGCYLDHPHIGPCRFPEVYGAGGHAHDHTEGGTICGATATIRVKERDMVTGWHTNHWFCRRHAARAREVKQQLAARGEPPEPIPNTGGLLPRYFAADWAKIYALHCEKAYRRWTEPYCGVDADHWPTPGKTMIPKRPRLALVADL